LIHKDNAHHHNSGRAQRCIKVSRAERLPLPADSTGLTPNDFFLFVYIKGKPSDYNHESREDLLNATTKIFTGIDQDVLLSVVKHRLKWAIKHEGKYYTK
jgi:hypothetical protein